MSAKLFKPYVTKCNAFFFNPPEYGDEKFEKKKKKVFQKFNKPLFHNHFLTNTLL